jgi:hypothetical protein
MADGSGAMAPSSPSKADLLAHAYSQGWLPPERAALYEHAVRSGYVTAPPSIRALVDQNGRERGGGDLRALGSGASFGLAKHLQAGESYLETSARNLVSRATGGMLTPRPYSAADAFKASEQAQTQQDDAFRAQHPRRALAEEIGGGLATPGLGAAGTFIRGAKIARDATIAAKAAALAGRAGRSAVVGGGIGAVSGAAHSKNLREVPHNALTGGGTGAVLGLGGEPLIEGAGSAVRAGRALATTGARRLTDTALTLTGRRGVTKLEDRAQETARTALRDRIGAAGTTPARMAREHAGKTVAEALGSSGTTELAAIARQHGTTPEKVVELMQHRRAGRDDRVQADIHSAVGIEPANARAGAEAVIAAGRKQADPLFAELRARPGPVWNSNLAKLAERPAIKSAIHDVSKNLHNAGIEPKQVGLMIDPDSGSQITDNMGRVLQHQPTFETWENVRQAIGSAVKRNDLTGKLLPGTHPGEPNFGSFKAQQDLSDAMKSSVPGFAKALSVAGDYKAVEGVHRRFSGALFSDLRVRTADFHQAFNGLKTEAEKSAARHALAQDMFDHAQGKTALISKMLRANGEPVPAVRAKLKIAFGEKATAKLFGDLQRHREEIQFENRVMPANGSPTMPLNTAARRQADESGGSHLRNLASAASRGNLGAAVAGASLGEGFDLTHNGKHPIASMATGALGGLAARHGMRTAEMVEMGHRNALGDLLLSPAEDVRNHLISPSASGARPTAPRAPAGPIGNALLDSLTPRLVAAQRASQ